MRRITLWLLATVAGLVLLFSYKPETEAETAPTVAATPAETPTTTPTTNPAGTAPVSETVDGTLVQTRQGPVQVRITVVDGQITDVQAVIYPSDSQRHREVSARALPILRQSALEAQSADVDTVSGATATSDGYRESLQAAIDQAHLA